LQRRSSTRVEACRRFAERAARDVSRLSPGQRRLEGFTPQSVEVTLVWARRWEVRSWRVWHRMSAPLAVTERTLRVDVFDKTWTGIERQFDVWFL
jgi:hypothetical protein